MAEFDADTDIEGGGSYQGAFSSSYTNWVADQVQNVAADWIAYSWWVSNGSTAEDLAKAIEVSQALQNGEFSLSDLFLAAQTKGTATLGDIDGVPVPMITVAGETFDLSAFFGTETDLVDWSSGKATNLQNHYREFLTTFTDEAPDGYTEDWSNPDVNQPPTATPLGFNLTEDAAFLDEIDLLSTASDPDGDTLALGGSLTFKINGVDGDQPDFITIVDNIVTVDTSHSDLQPDGAYDLKLGETLTVVVSYTIEDGQGGSTTNALTLNIAGAEDTYTATEDLGPFTKIGGGELERSFSGTFTVDLNGFDGKITMSGNADLNAANETLTFSADGHVFGITGGDSNSSSTEVLLPYSGTVTLDDGDFSDGDIAFTASFTQQVANGSTVNLELEYSYLA